MKFISKSSNLLIVLRPGLSAQPITGTPAKPTVSVRFKDGVADVQSQELVELMLAHPGFNGDFISAEGVPADPYAMSRESSEPAHSITEVKFGTPVSKVTKGGNPQLSPEIMKLVQQMATKMATDMLPAMVESTIKEIVSTQKDIKTSNEEKVSEVEEEETTESVKSAPKKAKKVQLVSR